MIKGILNDSRIFDQLIEGNFYQQKRILEIKKKKEAWEKRRKKNLITCDDQRKKGEEGEKKKITTISRDPQKDAKCCELK